MGMTINRKNILKYADKYDEQYRCTNDEKVEKEMKTLLRNQRYLKKEEFKKIVGWKTRNRSVHYCEENESDRVRKLTKRSFCVGDEKDRIESLLGQKGGLKGVGYPVASTILHFAFPNRYPIMDFRVIRSLGLKNPSIYRFEFWQKYCKEIQCISKKFDLDIRTVEKALWKYDKHHSGRKKRCK
ncbi:MAG: hypothetical protein MUP16_02560 [Sedimentisphaerales bacterium]|nr:hypothetical protein [Sedimentisphaerales bacterium]